MKPTRVTRKYLRDRQACYSDYEIAAVVPARGLTPIQVCDRTQVPAQDRLWVLLHTDWLTERQMRLLACKWARGALESERAAGREPDKRSWHAVEVAELFARGRATGDELAAAWAAALAADRDADGAAAWAAAWAAAGAAAWAAALAASWAADRDAQIKDVRTVLSRKGRR